jgi:hypothetical protein
VFEFGVTHEGYIPQELISGERARLLGTPLQRRLDRQLDRSGFRATSKQPP